MKKIFLSILAIILIVIISIIAIINSADKTSNELITSDLFNQKLVYNFGFGSSYEIDIPKIISSDDEIVIRNNYILLLYSNEENISIGKNETLFENLPPNRILIAGASENYRLISETDSTKFYEVTYRYSYMSPNGAESEGSIYYTLYKKADDCTLEIKGDNKDKILEIEQYIIPTNQTKTLEEQFYGITIFDNRIIDTSKITINEIYNVGGFLDIGIVINNTDIDIRFLSESDKDYLPELKQIENWNLITEKEGYQIYHGNSSSIQSDALKVIKDNKEYYIDLSIPINLYQKQENINDDGSTSIYVNLPQEIVEKIIEEIFNII